MKENNSGDFKSIENNVGYYNYKNEIIFFGEFADDFYKSGILMKKEGEDYNIYFGKFELDVNIQKFEGIFLPGIPGLIINGSIIRDEIIGIVLHLKDDNSIQQIYYGKMENNKKVGENITINFDDHNLVSKGTNSYTYYPKLQLLKNDTPIFRLLKDDIIYQKSDEIILYYPNSDIYVGHLDDNYNRKGEGQYHILNDNITISGIFDEDNINSAVIKNNDNFILFEGKFLHNKMSEGIYHFSETERFEGTFEDNKKKKGLYYYANGTTYESEWSNDRKVGKGIYTNEKGEKKEIFY